MKTRLFLIGLIIILLQGCIVKSLHPFFHEANVVFNENLLSSWVDHDGNQWNIKRFKEKHGAYEVHTHQGGHDFYFAAHLFQLEGEMYFDFLPYDDDREEGSTLFNLHIMPTHSIAKLEVINKNEVHIKWFDEEWLRSLFDQNRIKISHETLRDITTKDKDAESYVLTASTDELQKFIIKYGNDVQAFGNNSVTWLKLKRVL